MEVEVQLTDLYNLHTRLEWDAIIAAAAIVLGEKSLPPFRFNLQVVDVPTFYDEFLHMTIWADRIGTGKLAKRRRTLEWAGLVEFAAIALAGLGLYHVVGHEILEVAIRNSGGD